MIIPIIQSSGQSFAHTRNVIIPFCHRSRDHSPARAYRSIPDHYVGDHSRPRVKAIIPGIIPGDRPWHHSARVGVQAYNLSGAGVNPAVCGAYKRTHASAATPEQQRRDRISRPLFSLIKRHPGNQIPALRDPQNQDLLSGTRR